MPCTGRTSSTGTRTIRTSLASGNAYGSPPISAKAARITDSVTGNRNVKRGALTRYRSHTNGSRDLLDHRTHDVQANATARDFRHLLCRGEAGQEQKLKQLFVTHRGGHGIIGQPALDDLAAQLFRIDPAAIVTDLNRQHAGVMTRFEHDQTGFGFACRPSLLRRLDAVIQTVPQDVIQRCFQLAQNVAVDSDGCRPESENEPACRTCGTGRGSCAGRAEFLHGTDACGCR